MELSVLPFSVLKNSKNEEKDWTSAHDLKAFLILLQHSASVYFVCKALVSSVSHFQFFFFILDSNSDGWLSGESARHLLNVNLGFHAICRLRLLFVLSFAATGFSPGTVVFPSPRKPIFSNSNSTRNDRRRITMWMCYLLNAIYLFIY